VVETATATAHAAKLRVRPQRLSIAGSRVLWACAALTAAGAAIRFSTLGLQSYHHDEVVTVARVLPGSFGHMLHEVHRSESTPPLYYVLAWLWGKAFGLGEVAMRFPSALLGTATIPIAYLTGRELAGRRTGLILMAFVAVNPMLIWYSQEARAYALLVLLCAVSLLFFLRFRGGGRGSDLALWSISSALAVASHYFAAFPIAIEAAWLFASRRRDPSVWAAAGAIAAMGLALAPLAVSQASHITHIDWIGHTAVWARLEDAGFAALIGETGKVIGAVAPREGYAAVPAALVAALAGLAMLGGREGSRRGVGTGLAIGLGSVALALVGAAVGRDYVLDRNLLPALLPLLAAAAAAAAGLRFRRLGIGLAAVLCAYWLAFDIHVDTTQGLQRPDFRAVAARIGPPARPRTIVTWLLGVAPLQYYLHDGGQLIPAGGGPIRVAEIDLVVKHGDERAADPLAARFPHRSVTSLGRLSIIRYRGPHPITLGMRFLRHLPTGFEANGVLVDGARPGTIGRAPLAPPLPPPRQLPRLVNGTGSASGPRSTASAGRG
jgi:hypothetical protein